MRVSFMTICAKVGLAELRVISTPRKSDGKHLSLLSNDYEEWTRLKTFGTPKSFTREQKGSGGGIKSFGQAEKPKKKKNNKNIDVVLY